MEPTSSIHMSQFQNLSGSSDGFPLVCSLPENHENSDGLKSRPLGFETGS